MSNKNESMKRILFFLVLFAAVGLQSAAATPVYKMGGRDGSNGEQVVDGEMLFYDSGGPDGNASGFMTGYVTFKAKETGQPLTIEFTTPVAFNNDDSHLYIYDGASGYPANSGWKKPVPEGYKADLVNGSTFSYTSTSGTIEVLYYAPSSSPKENGAGWAAQLYTAPPKPMEFKSITAMTNLPGLCYPGVKDCVLGGFDTKAEGSLNPMRASNINFALSGEGIADITNIRLLMKGLQYGDTIKNVDNVTSCLLNFTDTLFIGASTTEFRLVADFKDSAVPGHKLNVSATAAIIGDTARIDSPLAATERTVANMLLMPTGQSTYTVGETPINFYDDGGPDAKYTANFSGTTTFRSEVAGKKVCIDFTKLALFCTSSSISVGNNDIIRIYNGSETVDSMLLATIISNDTMKVYSTAPDGALTVTFTSKTAYPTDGFEAIVSLFTPIAMTVDQATSTAPYTGTVAGGATEPFLLLDLQTVGTEPAAKAEAFSFSTVGATKGVLYALGSNKDASGSKISEATVSEGNLLFNIPTGHILNQRHNYFRLDLSVPANAQNDTTVSATATLVRVNSVNKIFSPSAEAKRIVFNEALSLEGNNSYTIYSDWEFRNKPSEYSYYGYDADSKQVTTFLPGIDGTVVEMLFSKHNITYPSYSSYTPTLKVINGTTESGTVLYEVTSDTKAVVPTQVFRSSDPSGALTIVFNPNGTKGSSGAGFTAQMHLYKSQPMQIERVEGFQAPEADVAPGSCDNAVLGMKVVAEGDQNPLNLKSIKVNLKGCGDIIKVVKLYTTSDSETFDLANASILATDTIVSGAQTSTLNTEFTLPERTSYYWITYDMADSFASDLPVDAAFAEVKIGDLTPTMTNADPEGNSITKNIYYFRGNDDVVYVSGSMMFYDDGGPDGKYTTSHKGKVTFMPATEGQVLKFIFHSFYTNINDNFDVYNGSSTETTDRLARLYSNKTNLPDILSTADNGALTVVFNPSKNNINQGWSIEVLAFTPQPLSIDSITVESIAPSKLLRGSENNPMLHVAVNVAGDLGNIDINRLCFSTPDVGFFGLKMAKVYYTGTENEFSSENKYAESKTLDPKFDGNVHIKLPGIYHFWLAYDILPNSFVGENFTAILDSVTISGISYTPVNEVKASATVGEAMRGTFLIGKSADADFHTFAAATNAMRNGIDGPVILEVEDGEYTELIQLDAIPGNSSVNTLTLRSKSGDRSKVKVSVEEYSEPSNFADQYGVLTLNGICHATVEGITFTTDNTKFDGIIYIKNQSRNDTIRNCHVYTETTTSYSYDINLLRTYAADKANCNNDGLVLEGNLFEGGYIGTTVGGTTIVGLPRETGAVIRNNTYLNQGSKGIYIQGENDALITGNVITHTGTTMNSSYYAMDLYRLNGNSAVTGNVIDVTDCKMGTSSYGGTAVGIYLRDITNAEEGHRRFYNNDIRINGNTENTTLNSLYGIQLQNSDTVKQTCEFIYNTIVLTGNAKAQSSAFYANASMGSSTLRNNLLQAEFNAYAIRFQKYDYVGNGLYDHNNLYSVDSTAVGCINSQAYNFIDMISAAHMSDCRNLKAAFLTNDIHELDSLGMLGFAVTVDNITTDLNGTSRLSSGGAVGAYEYTDQTVAPTILSGYPAVTNITYDHATVNIAADRTGQAYILVKPANDVVPSEEEVLASTNIVTMRANKSAAIEIGNLSAGTEYKAFALLRSLKGTTGSVVASTPFFTASIPTAVSTFEQVTTGDTIFEDGTARFCGFNVIEYADGPGQAPAAKVAMMASTSATVTPTNAQAINLEGFFIRNLKTVTLTATNTQSTDSINKTKSIAPGNWRYISLRDMGEISALIFEIAATDTVLIDDFSGQPNTLTALISSATNNGLEGSQAQFTATINGGVWPYEIEWKDQTGKLVCDTEEAQPTLSHSMAYTLSVTDAWGNTASDQTTVRVSGNQYAATFEDLLLSDENTNWHGENDGKSTFFSGSWEFPNYYMKQYQSWSWFGYSNSTSTIFSGINDQYNNVVGGGDRSANYGVVFCDTYMGPCIASLTNSADGDTVRGISLTNSAWVKDAILNGDGMSTISGGFTKGDWLTLTLTATRADSVTATKTIYLADYRDENEAEHYFLNNWEWFDLSDMGKVKSLKLTMEGTKANSYGLTTPTYVMIDNLGAACVRDTLPVQTIQLHAYGAHPAHLNLATVLGLDVNAAKVTYSLVNPADNIELQENGEVLISGPRNSEHWVIADVCQRGHTSHVAIPVHIDQEVGVDVAIADQVKIWPIPARETLNVNVDLEGYTVDIFDLSGRIIGHEANCTGHTVIGLDAVAAGHYVVRVSHPQLTYTKRIVVSK